MATLLLPFIQYLLTKPLLPCNCNRYDHYIYSNRGNDIWGWTDPMTGDEYAIMGVSGGTSFVRITDPERPFVVAFMYTQ